MLKLCDARDGLKELADGSVDLIVSDIPYKVQKGGRSVNFRTPSGILKKNDGKIFKHNDIDISEYADELYRVLKPETHCYIFTNMLNLFKIRDEMLRVGFKFHNILEWIKPNVTPNRYYMSNREHILFFRKGNAKTINNPGTKAALHFPNPTGKNRHHPTEKPVELLKTYIDNSSQPGDVVLDPFMGSGSTGVACKQSGREFIGFEIDPNHYVTACRRIGVLP